jgi:flagellar protein FlgJ
MIDLKNVNFVKPLEKIDEKKLTKNEKSLKEATEEFESIFIKMLLDAQDKTVDRENSMFYGGNSEDIFRSMLNQERAKDLAKSGEFGLAKIMYEQLSKNLKK